MFSRRTLQCYFVPPFPNPLPPFSLPDIFSLSRKQVLCGFLYLCIIIVAFMFCAFGECV
ncbi:hypothetical protein Hanom_Chr16g01482751 [Helianthus anomalus]